MNATSVRKNSDHIEAIHHHGTLLYAFTFTTLAKHLEMNEENEKRFYLYFSICDFI